MNQALYKIARYAVSTFGTLAILYFAWVMLGKIMPYFSFQHAIHFLGTKTDEVLGKTHFIWAFYLHITSSWVVLMTGMIQFFPFLVQKYPGLHRTSGKIYLLFLLVLAAPSGLVLALYANGGLPARVGFFMQCVLWWGLTWAAWRALKLRQLQQHAGFMIRSYAVTLAAMSLRTESYFMYYWLGTKPIETYVTVTWLSWVGNWILAELLIYLGLDRRLLREAYPKTTHIQSSNI